VPNEAELKQIFYCISWLLASSNHTITSNIFDEKFEDIFDYFTESVKIKDADRPNALDMTQKDKWTYIQNHIHYLFTHGYPDLAARLQSFFNGQTHLFN
jgi:hypothetical protein